MRKPGFFLNALLVLLGAGAVGASAYLRKPPPSAWAGTLLLAGLALEAIGGVGLLYQWVFGRK